MIWASAGWPRKDEPFVGRELRQRPMLQAPERWSLVGIECLEPEKRLRGGSILFAAADNIAGHGRGYITSVTWSTELKKFIALGLYQGGLHACGRRDRVRLSAQEEQVKARIVSAGIHRSERGAPACLTGTPCSSAC